MASLEVATVPEHRGFQGTMDCRGDGVGCTADAAEKGLGLASGIGRAYGTPGIVAAVLDCFGMLGA